MTDRELFLGALEIKNAAERERYLVQELPDDEPARHRIRELLQAAEIVGGFLEVPAVEMTTEITDINKPMDLVGTMIAGRYKLREKLGEGGMGSVWVADQSEPVQRRVAIKLLKSGSASKNLLARFEQERQALALMDHPNIAKIYDAGIDQQPYFVMELIKGVPLTKYCDEAKLTTQQRLELFILVCQAVQHAHQKGIIHRDLKPGNILIGLYDGKPVPKIIDFGVAKVTGLRLTEETIYTELGIMVGTLEYMSPEQVQLNNLDIDTRSDIYALGVILYELLTGTVPWHRNELFKAGIEQAFRAIKEIEPAKPSTKLSRSGTLSLIAANRQTEPAKLTKLMKGELDWIVMKALEKERGRRYETANGFALDVQNYLAGERVLAVPPSAWYRFSKLVARNRVPVVAAGLVALALVVGIIGTSIGLIEAKRQETIAKEETREKEKARLAEADRAESERIAKADAQKRLAQIVQGNEIITSIFTDLDLKQTRDANNPLEVVLAKRLVSAAKQLEGDALGDPVVVARMQNRLSLSLINLGFPQEAIPFLKKARATFSDKQQGVSSDLLACMDNLAAAYRDLGQFHLALPLLEESLKNRKIIDGVDHVLTLRAMSSMAACYQGAGSWESALPLFVETLHLRKAKLGADHPETLVSMNNLATCYQSAGKLDLALPLFEQAYQLKKTKLPANHPDMLTSKTNLAICYLNTKKLDLALPLLQEALAETKRKMGADHPQTLVTMHYLGAGYRELGKLDEATFLAEQAVKGMEKRGFLHKSANGIIYSLIVTNETAKRFDQAEVWRRKLIDLKKGKPGYDSLIYAAELGDLGTNLMQQQKWTEAETVFCEALAIGEKTNPDDWTTFETMSLLGEALLGQKNYAEAELQLLRGYEGLKEREGSISPEHSNCIPKALSRLIKVYEATNKPEEARKYKAELDKYPSTSQIIRE